MPPRLPRSPGARVIAAAGALLILVLALVGGRSFLERHGVASQLRRMREDLAGLRASAENCQVALSREEEAFQRVRAEVDSLRGEVRDYEALDDRGVPADRYDEYLEVFDRYNESVPVWQERADSLRAHSEACRGAARRHNALADSLRDLLEALQSGG